MQRCKMVNNQGTRDCCELRQVKRATCKELYYSKPTANEVSWTASLNASLNEEEHSIGLARRNQPKYDYIICSMLKNDL